MRVVLTKEERIVLRSIRDKTFAPKEDKPISKAKCRAAVISLHKKGLILAQISFDFDDKAILSTEGQAIFEGDPYLLKTYNWRTLETMLLIAGTIAAILQLVPKR